MEPKQRDKPYPKLGNPISDLRESESMKPTVRAVVARGEREHRAIHRTSVVNYEHARPRDASGALDFGANGAGAYGEEDLDILLFPYSMLRSIFVEFERRG